MTSKLVISVNLVCVLVLFAGCQSQTETIDTRIGKLSFTHDFANGYPTLDTQQRLFNEMDFQRA